MAAVFLAQATNTHLDLGQQLVLLVVAMLSSTKGTSGELSPQGRVAVKVNVAEI